MFASPKITKRHLPHWSVRGTSYFVTFRTKSRVLSIKEQLIVLEHLKWGDGRFYSLNAGIVMPDHVHIIITPYEEFTLSQVMKGIKGVSARKINQIGNSEGTVWQDESYDHIIRNSSDYFEKMNYMLNNPVKKGLTSVPLSYHGWYFNPDAIEPWQASERTGLTVKNDCPTQGAAHARDNRVDSQE